MKAEFSDGLFSVYENGTIAQYVIYDEGKYFPEIHWDPNRKMRLELIYCKDMSKEKEARAYLEQYLKL